MVHKIQLDFLVEPVKACPVCGSGVCSSFSIQGHLPGSNRYTSALCEALGIDESLLLARLKLFSCSNCKAEFYDPYLSVEARSILYNQAYPLHNRGWSIFDNYMGFKSDYSEHLIQRDKILKLLTKAAPIVRYAEVICPMNGLFPLLMEREKQSFKLPSMVETKKRIFLKKLDAFLARLIGSFGLFTGLHKRICFYLRRRAVYKEVIFRDLHSSANNYQDIKKYLIDCPSSMVWKNHCNKWGFHCSAFSQYIIPISATSQIPDFDCIGLYNILDHVDQPLDVLRLLLGNSKLVFVDTHLAAAAQHSFFLTSKFFENLPNLIPGLKIRDVSQYVIGRRRRSIDNAYYLMSMSIDIHDFLIS